MCFPVWVRRKGCPSELVGNGDCGIRPLALQPLSSSVEMVTRRVHVPVRLPGGCGISLGLLVLKHLLQDFGWFYCYRIRAKCSFMQMSNGSWLRED